MDDKELETSQEDIQEGAQEREPIEETAVAPGDSAEVDETAFEDEDEEPEQEKLFTVDFNISVDELYHFQLVMGRDQIAKNKKRSRIVSIVELALGALYIVAIITGFVPRGMLQYLLTAALIALGIYGLVYYKMFFYKTLWKNVEKQHGKVKYFNSDIHLDLYANKCVERFEDQENPTYWRNILGVMDVSDAYYIQLDTKHCLLIPKRCAGEDFGPFLKRVCEDFEKTWKVVDEGGAEG